jgi:hypothetical protein
MALLLNGCRDRGWLLLRNRRVHEVNNEKTSPLVKYQC